MTKHKTRLKFIVISLFTALIFVVLFTKIDFQEVLTILVSVNAKLLILAIAVSIFANVFLASDKLRRILKAIGCFVSFKEALLIVNGACPLTFILPLKSGEVAKAIYLMRRKKIGFEYGMSSVLLDKVLNLFGVLILLFIGLIFYKFSVYDKVPIFSSVLIISFLTVNQISSLRFVIDKFRKINVRGFNFIKQMIGITRRINLKTKVGLVIYSVIFQMSELITAYILFRALGLIIPFKIIIIFIPIVVLLSNIPVAISGLGMREASIVFLFFEYGSQEKLLTAGILISFVEYILPALIGLFLLKPFIERIYR